MSEIKIFSKDGLAYLWSKIKNRFMKRPRNESYAKQGNFLKYVDSDTTEWAEFPALLNYKGVIATYDELTKVENPSKGDVYTVTDQSNSEYFYNGTTWEFMGKVLDGNYVKISGDTMTGALKVKKSGVSYNTSVDSGNITITNKNGSKAIVAKYDSTTITDDDGTIMLKAKYNDHTINIGSSKPNSIILGENGQSAWGTASGQNVLCIGDQNSLATNARDAYILGANNTIGSEVVNYTLTIGKQNQIGNDAKQTLIIGEANSNIGTIQNSIIAGRGNEIQSPIQDGLIVGINNQLQNTYNSGARPLFLFGERNYIYTPASSEFTYNAYSSLEDCQSFPYGYCAAALGQNNVSLGSNAFSAGHENRAFGDNSLAVGENNKTFGAHSIAMGQSTLALKRGSIALGKETKALSPYSIAIGKGPIAGYEGGNLFDSYNSFGIQVKGSQYTTLDGTTVKDLLVRSDGVIYMLNPASYGTSTFYLITNDTLDTGYKYSTCDKPDFDNSTGGMAAIGYCEENGTIVSSCNGSVATGYAIGSGSITASSEGTFTHGYATSDGEILANNAGATAIGRATGGGLISSTEWGTLAYGSVLDGGKICSTFEGSLAGGEAVGEAYIVASGAGALAHGYVEDKGSIIAAGRGSHAEGKCEGGTVEATFLCGPGCYNTGDNCKAYNQEWGTYNQDDILFVDRSISHLIKSGTTVTWGNKTFTITEVRSRGYKVNESHYYSNVWADNNTKEAIYCGTSAYYPYFQEKGLVTVQVTLPQGGVIGDFSHGEGLNYTIDESAEYSHAEGINNQVYGRGSHVEGGGNTCTGDYSQVAGMDNDSYGLGSITLGAHNYSTGIGSVTAGAMLTNNLNYCTVTGKCNQALASDSSAVFVVGNGDETEKGHGHNAIIVNQTDEGKGATLTLGSDALIQSPQARDITLLCSSYSSNDFNKIYLGSAGDSILIQSNNGYSSSKIEVNTNKVSIQHRTEAIVFDSTSITKLNELLTNQTTLMYLLNNSVKISYLIDNYDKVSDLIANYDKLKALIQ